MPRKKKCSSFNDKWEVNGAGKAIPISKRMSPLAAKIYLSRHFPSVLFFVGKQLVPISLQECHPQAGAEENVPYETCSLQDEEKGVSCKDHQIMMSNDPFPTYMIYPETLSD